MPPPCAPGSPQTRPATYQPNQQPVAADPKRIVVGNGQQGTELLNGRHEAIGSAEDDFVLIEHGAVDAISSAQEAPGLESSSTEDKLMVQSQLTDGLQTLVSTTAAGIKEVCNKAVAHVESSYEDARVFEAGEQPPCSKILLNFSSTGFAVGTLCSENSDYSPRGLVNYVVLANAFRATGVLLGALGFGAQAIESTATAVKSRLW